MMASEATFDTYQNLRTSHAALLDDAFSTSMRLQRAWAIIAASDAMAARLLVRATGGKKQRTCLGRYDLSAPTPDKNSGRKDDTDGAGGAGSSSGGAGATGSSQAVA